MDTNSHNATPWYVSENDFPKDGSFHEKMQFVLRYAVLAPSFYNSQPWWFAIDDPASQINIYVNPSHWLKVADPLKRELYISLGCALENLLIAINYFGLGHSVAYFPEIGNEGWAVRVGVVTGRESLAPRPANLFEAISHTQIYHHPYSTQPLTSEHMDSISDFLVNYKYEDSDMNHQIRLETSDDPDLSKELARLAAHGDAIMFADAKFRSELNVLFSQSKYGEPWWYKTESGWRNKIDVGMGEYVAEQESQIVTSAPLMGILTSNFDNPTTLIKIGQAYERIALEANLVGVGIYPMFQLMELKEMHSMICDMLPSLHGNPQMVFAMGYAKKDYVKAMTPRIPVEEVMLRA